MGAAELLAPLDTSSPRGTMRGFTDTMDHIYSAVTQRHTHPPGRARMQHLFSQMMSSLDLSTVAPSLVITEGREAAVCLKEVLDRVPVPADSEIPDADAVREQNITRWRVPGTEIVLVRLATGDRAGEFVFAADTVSRAKEFFQRVNALPHKPTAGSPGLHQAYVTLGGWMIPDQFLHSPPSGREPPLAVRRSGNGSPRFCWCCWPPRRCGAPCAWPSGTRTLPACSPSVHLSFRRR